MQLNNLQSIILKDYAETLEKAVIHKTIDKIATLIAEDVSVSIYQKLLEQSTTNIQSCKDILADKDTSSCKDTICKNTSCKDTSSGKNIAFCKDKNNTCQCCSEHNSTIGKMRKFNQRHKINRIKVNDQRIDDNANNNVDSIQDNSTVKNDPIQDNSIQDNSIKNDSLFDSISPAKNISSPKNNSQSEYNLSNNTNNKNDKDTNNKNDIDKVDVILNKLIDILETGQKTNNKASEILSKDELNKLFKAAFALNEMCPFHHDEVFKAFFNFK